MVVQTVSDDVLIFEKVLCCESHHIESLLEEIS